MRIEFIMLLIVSGFCYYIYTDGKVMDIFLKHKKYYQMGGVIIVGLIIYWLLKKDPQRAHKILLSSNEYVKYLPIDSTTSSIITPIIDFTKKLSNPAFSSNMSGGGGSREKSSITKMMSSGGQTTKRSVSEPKKKFVASNQDWCCYDCKEKLKATFEVDHIIPLYKGGNNHIDNLHALCPECHRARTISDKL